MVSMQDGAAAYDTKKFMSGNCDESGKTCSIELSFGCTLIQSCGKNILCDTSLGSVAPPVPPECRHRDLHKLLQTAAGLLPQDIDIVILSHAHTDHVGGCVCLDKTGRLVPASQTQGT